LLLPRSFCTIVSFLVAFRSLDPPPPVRLMALVEPVRPRALVELVGRLSPSSAALKDSRAPKVEPGAVVHDPADPGFCDPADPSVFKSGSCVCVELAGLLDMLALGACREPGREPMDASLSMDRSSSTYGRLALR
jgi:hypothetical protein